MEGRTQEIRAKSDKEIKIGIIPGHFATNHSHINYYVDLTSIKTRHQMANKAATVLAEKYKTSTMIDTILCMEGTEVIGAFIANELAQSGPRSTNSDKDIYVLTPEYNSNNQIIFRDNTQKMIWGKNILLLIASVSTGKTINRAMECLKYYNGRLLGIAALFSAIRSINDLSINTIFTENDFPLYRSFEQGKCVLCAEKQKIDAIVVSGKQSSAYT